MIKKFGYLVVNEEIAKDQVTFGYFPLQDEVAKQHAKFTPQQQVVRNIGLLDDINIVDGDYDEAVFAEFGVMIFRSNLYATPENMAESTKRRW